MHYRDLVIIIRRVVATHTLVRLRWYISLTFSPHYISSSCWTCIEVILPRDQVVRQIRSDHLTDRGIYPPQTLVRNITWVSTIENNKKSEAAAKLGVSAWVTLSWTSGLNGWAYPRAVSRLNHLTATQRENKEWGKLVGLEEEISIPQIQWQEKSSMEIDWYIVLWLTSNILNVFFFYIRGRY
jgi:hypothetical protein